MKAEIYILTEDVKNPSRDRRKAGIRGLDVWPKGTRFKVLGLGTPHAWVTVGMEDMTEAFRQLPAGVAVKDDSVGGYVRGQLIGFGRSNEEWAAEVFERLIEAGDLSPAALERTFAAISEEEQDEG